MAFPMSDKLKKRLVAARAGDKPAFPGAAKPFPKKGAPDAGESEEESVEESAEESSSESTEAAGGGSPNPLLMWAKKKRGK